MLRSEVVNCVRTALEGSPDAGEVGLDDGLSVGRCVGADVGEEVGGDVGKHWSEMVPLMH